MQHTSSQRSERSKPSIYWVLAGIAVPVLRLMIKRTIIDGDKLPKQGPFIVVSNHMSELDPLVVGWTVWSQGRIPRFMAKASLFRIPVVGWVLKISGQIPVERTTSKSKQSIGQVEKLNSLGGGVIIYPEGTLTGDPNLWPMKGKTGAARIALAGDLPVIPVAHWGVQQIMPRYGKLNIFPRKSVTVKFGDPITLTEFAAGAADGTATGTSGGVSSYLGATDSMMRTLSTMVGELRQEQPPQTLWDPVMHKKGPA